MPLYSMPLYSMPHMAAIVHVPGDAHECAYHVMGVAKALHDGSSP